MQRHVQSKRTQAPSWIERYMLALDRIIFLFSGDLVSYQIKKVIQGIHFQLYNELSSFLRKRNAESSFSSLKRDKPQGKV